jgi:hypothetical protein
LFSASPLTLHFLTDSIIARRSFQLRDDRAPTATASFEPQRGLPRKRNTIDSHTRGEHSQFLDGNLQIGNSPKVQKANGLPQGSEHQLQSLTKLQLEALERQQAQEFGVKFESSVSGADSSSLSHRSDIPAYKTPLIGLGILEKPLPEIPIRAKERGKQTTLDKYLNARQHSYSDPNTGTPVKKVADYDMGFSFQPGDDEDLLAKRTERDRAQRRTVDEHLGYRPCLPILRDPGSNTPSSPTKEASRRPRLVQDPKATVSPKPSQLPRIQDHDHILGRMDSSSSSIVTAVRDNSGRSSANNSQAGQPRLKRNTDTTGSGSSDATSAVTAAARAYAVGNKRPSFESNRKGSGSGEKRKDAKGNDIEGSKSMMPNRTTSIASTTSSINGSEVDKAKKLAGGIRMI